MDLKLFLIDKYNKLTNRNKSDCLKISYQFNGVQVNLYFDAYDNENVSLNLILLYEKDCYYTSLNLRCLTNQKSFLPNCPRNILYKILNSDLTHFYESMREHIRNENFNVEEYDYDFIKVASKREDNDKPFLSHLRKANMQESHLKELNDKFNISKEVLYAIKKAQYTIVTTSDPKKRKNLTVILSEKDIRLNNKN
ncbi:MAG: hypothetical protein IJP87_03190 [Campylobacter sp.]|nr:hypothetical protein [Campylobacter sp.]MBQ7270214.1 hypothetical protein [Campylobacter sp.]MBR0071318.1 hypothetical protein [Campylobacter sp.]